MSGKYAAAATVATTIATNGTGWRKTQERDLAGRPEQMGQRRAPTGRDEPRPETFSAMYSQYSNTRSRNERIRSRSNVDAGTASDDKRRGLDNNRDVRGGNRSVNGGRSAPVPGAGCAAAAAAQLSLAGGTKGT
ncbi:hypothetical protein LX36DRAFT_698433 [Colletotrichum falcatum]|nr:hypothetical protein LX36DRAFT_698433 [Colletotrichum falcatum]